MKPLPILLALLCLNLVACSVTAQDHLLPGYIVRTSGDTLRGFLREQGTNELNHQIAFKSTAAGEYTTYSFDKVSSFQYQDGNLYRAISFSNVSLDQPVFQTLYARLLVGGEYDLYSFTEKDVLFFLVRKDTSFHLLFDDDSHVVGSNIKGNFRNELNFFSAFCESLRSGIESMVYGEQSMMQFFQKLDACLAPNKPVTSYYHKTKVVVGFSAYGGGIILGNMKSQMTGDARLKFTYPQLNPSISLNIGVRYASVVKKISDPTYLVAKIYHKVTYNMTSFPLTFQYNFLPNGIVQPYLFAGLSALKINLNTDLPSYDFVESYYHQYSVAGFGGGGVEVKIADFLRVKAEMRYEEIVEWPTVGLLLSF
jgi:hypothetical protein